MTYPHTSRGRSVARLAGTGALLLAVLMSIVGAATPVGAFTLNPATVFINEIHYDNAGTDTGEAVEIAGPAGTDLTGWSIVRYNGSTPAAGVVYSSPAAVLPGSDTLNGSIPDLGGGYGVVVVRYASDGLQNGPNDGLALVNAAGQVQQFLSYESPLTASNGPAAGLTSTDIGVAQGSATPIGASLQLTGAGTVYQSFTWTSTTANTFGAFNTGQSFSGGPPPDRPIVATCPANLNATFGTAATAPISAADADGTVTGASITSAPVAGIALGAVSPGATLNTTLNVDATTAVGTYSVVIAFTSSNSPGVSCTVTVAVENEVTPIGTIQGSVGDSANGDTFRSSFAPASGNGPGQTVRVQGVIYQRTLARTSAGASQNGFFIQNTAATADTDANSSDGIFVFMGAFTSLIGGYVPQVGDEVVISGRVSEFFSFTQLSSANLVRLVRSGVNVEAEVSAFEVNPPDDNPTARRYWERREGMRARVPSGSVTVDGRDVFAGTADAEIWLIRGDHPVAQRTDPYERRVFRDFHPLDNVGPPGSFDDGNGYRFLIASFGVKAAANDNTVLLPPARTFETLTNAPAGGVYYTFSKYAVMVEQQPVFTPGVDPALNDPPRAFNRAREYSVGPYNVENLYDFRDDPFDGCDFAGNSGCPGVSPPFDYVPASDAEYQARLDNLADQIIVDLHGPDIVMIAEAEDQDICLVSGANLTCGGADNADGRPDTLQELALRIAQRGGPAYNAAFDRDGSDARGIVSAFLYRADRVELVAATADNPILGSAPTVSYPGAALAYNADVQNPKALNAALPPGFSCASGAPLNCDGSNVFTRDPQVGLFRIYSQSLGVGEPVTLWAIANHFSSTPDGRVLQRREQARYNAAIVRAIQASNPAALVSVGGDLNVYPRPDDPFAPGQPYGPGLVGPSDQLGPLYEQGLINLFDTVLAENPSAAYGYVFQGQTQTLDHLLAGPALYARLVEVREAHINADFPADFPGDGPRGLSDHDPQVARFLLDDTAPTTTGAASGSTNPLCPSDCFQGSATVTLSAVDSQSGVVSTSYRVNGASFQPYTAPFAVSTPGANLIEFFSVDAAGNTEATRSLVVKVTTFPSAGVLDSFGRADGRLGANWTGATQRDQYAISGGAVSVGFGGLTTWRPKTFGADQEAFMRLTRINPAGAHHTLALKARGIGGSNGVILVSYDAPGQRVVVEALVAGQGFKPVTSFPLTVAEGALLGARARADGTVEVYVDCQLVGVGDTRTVAGSAYVNRGGAIGVWFQNSAGAAFDEFGGGDIR